MITLRERIFNVGDEVYFYREDMNKIYHGKVRAVLLNEVNGKIDISYVVRPMVIKYPYKCMHAEKNVIFASKEEVVKYVKDNVILKVYEIN